MSEPLPHELVAKRHSRYGNTKYHRIKRYTPIVGSSGWCGYPIIVTFCGIKGGAFGTTAYANIAHSKRLCKRCFEEEASDE